MAHMRLSCGSDVVCFFGAHKYIHFCLSTCPKNLKVVLSDHTVWSKIIGFSKVSFIMISQNCSHLSGSSSNKPWINQGQWSSTVTITAGMFIRCQILLRLWEFWAYASVFLCTHTFGSTTLKGVCNWTTGIEFIVDTIIWQTAWRLGQCPLPLDSFISWFPVWLQNPRPLAVSKVTSHCHLL
jgi:hypothetical protein